MIPMKNARKILQTYGTLMALAVIIIVFSVLRPTAFFTVKNFLNISRQISLMVIISIGATMVMSVNEFDLSVGSMASLGGVMSAQMAVAGLPLPLCFILPLLISLPEEDLDYLLKDLPDFFTDQLTDNGQKYEVNQAS